MSYLAFASPAADPAQLVTNQRRRSNRQALQGAATLVAESGPFQAPAQDVWVFDLSLSGIGFHSTRPAPIGSVHHINVETRTMHLRSRIRIARCDARDTGYDIGALFMED